MPVLAQEPGSYRTTKATDLLPKALPYESPNKFGLTTAFAKFPPKDQATKTDRMTDHAIIHQNQVLIFSVTVCGMVLPPSTPRQ